MCRPCVPLRHDRRGKIVVIGARESVLFAVLQVKHAVGGWRALRSYGGDGGMLKWLGDARIWILICQWFDKKKTLFLGGSVLWIECVLGALTGS